MDLIICGAEGRMGQEIINLAGENTQWEKVWSIHRKKEWPRIEKASVVIDFSSPEGLRAALKWSLHKKFAFISGTTGLEKEDFIQLKEASQVIPVLWSANMSIGISILLKVISSLKGIEGFDFFVEETHHVDKKDQPSGTAKVLHERMERELEKQIPRPTSFREGDVFGDHKIIIKNEEEVLQFSHHALSRKIFAKGALKAACWIQEKPPGLYTMEDLES